MGERALEDGEPWKARLRRHSAHIYHLEVVNICCDCGLRHREKIVVTVGKRGGMEIASRLWRLPKKGK